MGTGIVSIDLALDHRETLSRILLAIAAVAWVALGVLLAGRVADDRAAILREARTPAALTGVAATAVLGSGAELLGWSWAGEALLAIAFALWLALLVPVFAGRSSPTVGATFLLVVAPESLAVLASALAVHEHADWLLYGALGLAAVGLALYAFVLARFDFRQLLVGRGDHWITGGALAITTLAAGQIGLDARSLHALTGGALKDATLVLWALTIAWLPVLLASEALRPRPGYDLQRWATVFPVGMYAACSFAAGRLAHAGAITDFARVWVWVALALWLVVFGATSAAVVPWRRLHGPA
jgi:tellurite resistance protein TehA-like permease